MTHSNRRIRYEDFNWRVVTSDSNQSIWIERAEKDALGETTWKLIGEEDRCILKPRMDSSELLDVFWDLLDAYTLDKEE
jgi:hypothetical protein